MVCSLIGKNFYTVLPGLEMCGRVRGKLVSRDGASRVLTQVLLIRHLLYYIIQCI